LIEKYWDAVSHFRLRRRRYGPCGGLRSAASDHLLAVGNDEFIKHRITSHPVQRMPELTCTMFETAQLSNAGEPDDSACFREAGAATTA
jgi:hypothetical protein